MHTYTHMYIYTHTEDIDKYPPAPNFLASFILPRLLEKYQEGARRYLKIMMKQQYCYSQPLLTFTTSYKQTSFLSRSLPCPGPCPPSSMLTCIASLAFFGTLSITSRPSFSSPLPSSQQVSSS